MATRRSSAARKSAAKNAAYLTLGTVSGDVAARLVSAGVFEIGKNVSDVYNNNTAFKAWQYGSSAAPILLGLPLLIWSNKPYLQGMGAGMIGNAVASVGFMAYHDISSKRESEEDDENVQQLVANAQAAAAALQDAETMAAERTQPNPNTNVTASNTALMALSMAESA